MKITCTNGKDEISFGYFFPYYYVSCEGLMTSNTEIFTDSAFSDGDIYLGNHRGFRNLLLSFAVRHREYWNRRELVYKVFAGSGTFRWEPDTGEAREIDYQTESIVWSDPNSRGFRRCTVSLICPYPYFRGAENEVEMSYWRGFMLPGVMTSPFKIAERITNQIVTVQNDEAINLGLDVYFTAESGAVQNPSFTNVTTGESFTLNMTIQPGETVKVSTKDGEKWIFGTVPVDVWDYDSNVWLQIAPGKNELRYDAESGEENLNVRFSYNQLYIGG